MGVKQAKWIASGSWLRPQQHHSVPCYHAFRLDFDCSKVTHTKLFATADQRYVLWLDGEEIGRGPERGDLRHWFCNRHPVSLEPGTHRLNALVWSVPIQYGIAPRAQISYSPGFYLTADDELRECVTTGLAPWEVAEVPGVAYVAGHLHNASALAGCLFRFDGATWPQNLAQGEGLQWQAASLGMAGDQKPRTANCGSTDGRVLAAPMLPPQISQPLLAGRVRHLDVPSSEETESHRVLAIENLVDEIPQWQAWINGKASLEIPPNTRRRAIMDLGNYACAYSQAIVVGGPGGFLRVGWAESLYEKFAYDGFKGNRDVMEGKVFVGRWDRLDITGVGKQILEPLWWNAGRYIEIFIESGNGPLTLPSFSLRETRYPLEREDRCEVPLEDWNDLHQIMWRTLQMCAHETYMDCPYYEQLQYVGDTRLQMLVTYVSSHDARLPVKTMELFSSSVGAEGLTASAYPAFAKQIIPQFSLFWVAMLHDHLFWRGDEGLIRSLLPNARRVMDTFLERIQNDGSLPWPEGWNWVDWAWRAKLKGGFGGHPSLDETELSGINALQFVYVSGLIAEVEERIGEPLVAQRYREARSRVMEAARQIYWDSERGLFADTPARDSFSEHAQCYAVLTGLLSDGEKSAIARSLGKDQRLAPSTVYFRHYLFEAFTSLGCTERILEGLGLWRDLKAQGFSTTIERPDPSRSDCHAWGAHPIYHLYASLLGIRPAEPGFRRITIRPQLGGLPRLSGRIPHPYGWIEVKLVNHAGSLTGSVELPPDTTGEFLSRDARQTLVSGVNLIEPKEQSS